VAVIEASGKSPKGLYQVSAYRGSRRREQRKGLQRRSRSPEARNPEALKGRDRKPTFRHTRDRDFGSPRDKESELLGMKTPKSRNVT
jgi:hypothetical protein